MAQSRIKDENYYQIQGWMINRLKLKGVALSVYSIIYGFSQDGDNEYTGSLQYLCDFCGGVSKPTIIKALKELVEKKFILKREEFINNVQFNRYKANLTLLNNFNRGSKETLPEVVKNVNEGSKETLHNNNTLNNNFNNKENIKYIVDYLNSKANTKYKSSTKQTQQHINARFEEGFSIDDFKTVIDKKCVDWLGTDYEQYLRPATLFGTKFESYLNAKVVKKQDQQNKGSFDYLIQNGSVTVV